MADEKKDQLLEDDPLSRSPFGVSRVQGQPQFPPRSPAPPPLNMRDPKDRSLADFRALGELHKQGQVQSLAASFDRVAERNTADEREAFSLAAFLNRDPARVRGNLDAYREIARKQGFDYAHLLEVAPAVAGFAHQHPGVVVDDLARAGWWEWLTRAPVVAWRMGAEDVEFGRLGFADLAGVASIEDEKRMAELERTMGERYLGQDAWMTKSYVEAIRQLPILWGSLKWGVATGTAYAAGAALIGQLGPQAATPEEVVTMPAAFLIGTAYGMWAFNSSLEAGHTYKAIQQEFRRKGLQAPDDLETRAIAAFAGAVSGTLETASQRVLGGAAGVGRAIRGMASRKTAALVAQRGTRQALQNFVRRSATTMGTEVSTEILQEITQLAGVATAEVLKTGGSDMTMEQVVDQSLEIAVTTAQAMTIMGPLASSSSLIVDVRDARRTTREGARLEMLAGTVRGMEMLDQAPEAFRELAKQIGSRYGQMETAHIKVKDFNQVAEAAGIDPTELAQEILGSTDSYAQAVSEGAQGDLVIPMADFLTKVVPTPLYEQLKPHVRLSQAAMSEQQVTQKADAVREVLLASLPEVDTQLDQAEQTIYVDVYRQMLDETGDPSLADLTATTHARVISTLARREGIDPVAYHRTWGLAIEGPDNARVARAVDAEVRGILDERQAAQEQPATAPLPKAPRRSAIRDLGQVKTARDFYSWVKNMGGLKGGDRFSDLPQGDELFDQIPAFAKNQQAGKTISELGEELMQMRGSPFADLDAAADWLLDALQNPEGVELPRGLAEADLDPGSAGILEEQLEHDTELRARVDQVDALYDGLEGAAPADAARVQLEIASQWLEVAREFGQDVVDLLLRRDYGTSLRALQANVRRSGFDPEGESSVTPYDPRYEPDKLALWMSRNGGIDPKEQGAWRGRYPGVVSPGGLTLDRWAEEIRSHWPEYFPSDDAALEWLREEWATGAGKPQSTTLTGEAAVLEVRAQTLSADIQEIIREAREQGVRPDAAQVARTVLEDSGWSEVSSANLGEGDVVLERETGAIFRVVADGDQLRLEGRAGDLPLTAFNFYSAIPLGRRAQRFHQKKTEAQVRRGHLLRRLAPFIQQADVSRSKNATLQGAIDLIRALPSAIEMASVAWAGRKARRWYQRSARMILEVFGPDDAPRFGALLAALSPRTDVQDNLYKAVTLWAKWDAAGRPRDEVSIRRLASKHKPTLMGMLQNNIVIALTSEAPGSVVLSGPKVASFAKNLRGELRAVTNDGHMAYYFGIDPKLLESDRSEAKGVPQALFSAHYLALTWITRRAAAILHQRTGEAWEPAEVQAAVWAWSRTLRFTVKRDDQKNRLSKFEMVRYGMFGPGDVKPDDFAELMMSTVQRGVELFERGKLPKAKEVLGGLAKRTRSARRAVGDFGFTALEGGPDEGFSAGHAADLRRAARRLDERFPVEERQQQATKRARLREPGADYSPADQEQRASDALAEIRDSAAEQQGELAARPARELKPGDRVTYRGTEVAGFAGTEGTVSSVGPGKLGVGVDWDKPLNKSGANHGTHPATELAEPGQQAELDFGDTPDAAEPAGPEQRGGVRVLARDLPARIERDRGAELVGSTVITPRDLATLASILRDRRIETIRHFWIDKNGKIVSTEAGSSGMPGYSSIAIGLAPESAEDFIPYYHRLARRALRLLKSRGVRELYLMHNHPSATPTSSMDDRKANRRATVEFLAHQIKIVANEGAPKGQKRRVQRLMKAIEDDRFWPYRPHEHDPDNFIMTEPGALQDPDAPPGVREQLDDLTKLYDAGVLVEPRGHVVIDHDRYTWIGPTGELKSDLPTHDFHNLDDKPDPLRRPEDIAIPHPKLRAHRGAGPQDVAELGSQIVTGERDVVLIYADAAGRVVGLEEVPRGLLDQTMELANWVRGRVPEYGAVEVFLYTRDKETVESMRRAMQAGIVRDALIDTSSVWSAQEKGIFALYELGKAKGKPKASRRLWERATRYGTDPRPVGEILRERQRAYNGAGVRFPRFSTKFIGSGESTLNYGWGLYFTSLKAIGQWYRDADMQRKGRVATFFRGAEFQAGLIDSTGHAQAVVDLVAGIDLDEIRAKLPDDMKQAENVVLVHAARHLMFAWGREVTIRGVTVEGLRRRVLAVADNGIMNAEMARDGFSGKPELHSPSRLEAADFRVFEAKLNREVWRQMVPELTLQGREGQVAEVEIPGPEEMLHWNGAMGDIDSEGEFIKPDIDNPNHHAYTRLAAAGWDPEYGKQPRKRRPTPLADNTGHTIYRILVQQAAWFIESPDRQPGAPENIASDSYAKFLRDHDLKDPEEAASRYLDSIGIRGVAYVGRTSGEPGYVVFNDDQVSLPVAFYQDDRGRIDIDRVSKQITITLTDAADASTVFHEMAHFYLEAMADLVERPEASPELQADWAEVLRFLKVKTREQIDTPQHEKFARSFEEYLRRAQAPSEGLRSVFGRIRALMLAVYGQAEKLASLSPRIKDVFDRLLATEQEIAAARSAMRLEPIEALTRTMSSDELERYREAAEKAAAEAEDDLRVAALADAEEFREHVAGRRELMAAEIRTAWAESRLMTALHYLQRGRMIEGETPRELLNDDGKSLKLDKQALIDEFGGGILKQLARGNQHPYTNQADRATDPGTLAELLGYDSAAELIAELTGAPNYQKAFDEEIERRVEARYGDIMRDPGALTERAMDAVVAPAAFEQLLIELDHARRQLAPGEAANASMVDRASLKAYAGRVIAGKTIMELQPYAYAQAAQRHGTKAQRSTNPETIHRERMLQLVNLALYREARDARLEADRALRYARRMMGKSTQQMLGKADSATADPTQGIAGGSYQATANQLLEHFELRPESKRSTERRQRLRDWVAEQIAEGEDVVVTPRLVELTERAKKHFRELRVDEFRDLRNALQNIEGLARLKTKLLDGEDTRDFRRGVGELIDSGDANLAAAKPMWDPEVDRQRTIGETVSEWVDTWDSKLLRMEEIIDRLDGRDVRGPWTRLIWQPIVEAQNAENEMTATIAQALVQQFEKLGKKRKQDLLTEEVPIRRLGRSILKQTALVVALNTGNAGNYDRLLRGGMGLGEQWGPEVIEEILSTLTIEDWTFVQGLWDTLESLWPQIAALEKRVTGVAPPKVERVPFRRSFANETTGESTTETFEGGYYPIVYSERTRQAQQQAREGQSMLSLFGGKYVRAMTPHGHVQTRVESFGGELSTSLETVTQHVSKVIHDLTHREATMQIFRILHDREFMQWAWNRMGKTRWKALEDWLRRIIQVQNTNDPDVESFIRKGRLNVAAAAMGFKATVSLQNIVNLSNVVEKVPVRWFGPALRETMRHPIATREFIHGKSGEMKFRFQTLDRDIREALQRQGSIRGMTGRQKFIKEAQKLGFGVIAATDMISAYPAWIAAYRHAMAAEGEHGLGLTEKQAIAHADRTVRTTLSAGGEKDIANIQASSSELLKALTMFYGWFSTAYMRFRALGFDIRTARHKEEGAVARGLPWYLGRMLAFWIVPATVAELLANRGPDAEDDEGWVEWFITKTLQYPMLTIPVLRDASSLVEGHIRGERRSARFGALSTVLEETVRAGAVLAEEAVDLFGPEDFDEDKAAVAAARAMGYTMGLPSSQFEITGGYLWDVFINGQEPADVLEFIRHLLYRRSPEERKESGDEPVARRN